MRYLLDTQILIWALIKPKNLSVETKIILQTEDIYFSHISLFEIVIKQKIGKLPELPISVEKFYQQLLQDNFKVLEFSLPQLNSYYDIPLLEHHRDPFDRMLLAIALAEKMAIISSDDNFVYYESLIQLIKN